MVVQVIAWASAVGSVDAASWVALARVFGFVGLVVLAVRLRPWRWLARWVRARG